MSRAFERDLDERGVCEGVNSLPDFGRQMSEPSATAQARAGNGSSARQGFPDEGITISVSIRQAGSSSAHTAIFHDGSRPMVVDGEDSVSIFLSNERMVKCSRKSGMKHFHGLSVDRLSDIDDEVLCDLAMCLNFNRKNPKGSNSHFEDQIILAICAHVVQKYGRAQSTSGRVSNQLSPWQLRIAKQMLSGDMHTTPNLSEVADACRISTRHFTRSFTETIGTSPHQWSVLARLEHAKTILEDRTATLAETAVSCGFSDQSHFTRVFTREFGTSPARWRRSLDVEPS
jgi:AraC-like DNA-binding protein